MNSKQCKQCLETKSITDFYKHPETADGYLGICKECQKSRSRKRDPRKKQAYEKIRSQDPKRMKAIAKTSKNWRRNNPEKALAHSRLWHAIKRGEVIRPDICEQCGKEGRIHAHHEDYSKPLEVKWLCVPCHGKRNSNYQDL